MKKLRYAWDEWERRERELESIGQHREADRIRRCAGNPNPLQHYGWYYCGSRSCPTCSQMLAQSYAFKMMKVVRRMRPGHQQLFLITLRSRSIYDVREIIDLFQQSFRKLRARKFFKESVLSGVGLIEPLLTENGNAFVIHAHIILDVSSYFLGKAQRAWAKYTAGMGSFKQEDGNEYVAMHNLPFLAKYATKPNTWSPSAFELDTEAREALHAGIKGRRLLFAWGPAAKRDAEEPVIPKHRVIRRHSMTPNLLKKPRHDRISRKLQHGEKQHATARSP